MRRWQKKKKNSERNKVELHGVSSARRAVYIQFFFLSCVLNGCLGLSNRVPTITAVLNEVLAEGLLLLPPSEGQKRRMRQPIGTYLAFVRAFGNGRAGSWRFRTTSSRAIAHCPLAESFRTGAIANVAECTIDSSTYTNPVRLTARNDPTGTHRSTWAC